MMEKVRRAIAADAPHIERLLALPGALLAPLSARAASQRPVAQRLERELLSIVLVGGDGEVVGFASVADRVGDGADGAAAFDELVAAVQGCVVDAVVSVSPAGRRAALTSEFNTDPFP